MKQLRAALLLATTSTILFTTNAFSAAFQLYELGTPIVGTADVGQAALANDASTSYFNPAGMTRLRSSQYMLGSQLILPYTNFSQSSRTTISGDNGSNAAQLTPGINVYYVYSIAPALKLGVSLTTPYGGMLSYNDGWVGRYIVQNLTFYTVNLNPSLAYQFNDWLALGAGAAVEYANLSETVALPLPAPATDGQANIKSDNTNMGFNLGALFTPTPSTKLGVAYRSRITHNFRGRTTFLRIAASPSTSTKMVMPQNIIASVVQDIGSQFSLLGELGWSNWSTMNNTVVNIASFTAVTPRDWNDTYRAGFGAQYKPNTVFMLQAGASYDSSPTTSSHRLPDLPMDRQIRLGAGVTYTTPYMATLGFSYEYINFGNANINNTSSNGTLVGSYGRNYANVFQASLNVPV